MNQQTKFQHLYRRAGFGTTLKEAERLRKLSFSKLLEDLFAKSTSTQSLQVLEGSTPTIQEIRAMSKAERQSLRKSLRKQVILVNQAWLNQLLHTQAILREKMTLFWHDHFACQSKNPYHAQNQINTLRKYALGNFGDLVLAIAKDPAMLQFLNNQQNRKRKPNENFARELMELFTLGRGYYTEQDIKASARAFTGWGFNGDQYIFRSRIHDYGSKTFMGKTGNFNGEEIIQIILENPQTARYITSKIYKYFVNEKVDPNRVEQLSQSFYQSNYDIQALMQKILSADWFYAPENIGGKIKSPIELIIGLQKQLPLHFTQDKALVFLQKVLGQMLLSPPNVAGWPGGRSWIDSSTLMFRIRLPEMLYRSAELNIEAKAEGDVERKGLVNRQLKKMGAELHWEPYLQQFQGFKSQSDLSQFLIAYFLPNNPSSAQDYIQAMTDKSSPESFIKTACIALCTMPEYQLC